MFFMGFILGLVFCTVIIPWAITRLYLSSAKIRTDKSHNFSKQVFRNQTVISFSYIIPLAVSALAFAIIVGTRITRELSGQGHGDFIYFALVFPVFGFLIGYLYMKRMVKP